MLKQVGWIVLPVMLMAGSASAAPDCAGPLEIVDAHVVRVERSNDALVIRDGRAIHMEGIRIPHSNPDHAPAYIADQAYDAIGTLVRGKTVEVTAVPPKEDRYDRVRGQVFNSDEQWLQMNLLKSGLARVDIAPDRTECAAEYYAAEGAARSANLGLWAVPAYRVRAPEALTGGDTNTFQIVQGKVLTADVKDGRAYLDFGTDWKTDFTVTISPPDMANFRADGIDPRDYAGKTIRVRGIIQQFNGPEIEIANDKQIEVLP
ncbi:MAG TPA: thermonuclease family protein [Rhizomicrobium sp.]|nr:thermonuclease family protein [Rhizomicrobium sp.]